MPILVTGANFVLDWLAQSDKLEAELGWKPAEIFDTGIRKTVQWYLDTPDLVANVQSGAYKDWVNLQYAETIR
jgi:dTDP-glucose 4,6-dehydratase